MSVQNIATTTFTYDIRGRLTRTTDALGQSETFTYDQNSLLRTRTDRNGTLFYYVHDHMGRVIYTLLFENGVTHRYTLATAYHFSGAVSVRWTTSGHAIFYSYDAQGRLITINESTGVAVSYVYNTANNVTHFATLINGAFHKSETIHYDIAQRPQRVETSGTWGNVTLVTYTYDANGNRTSAVLGNGVRTDYTFNLANQVTSVINRHGNTILSRFDYTHFLDGNVHQKTEQYQDTSLNRTITYTYDLARRLTQEQVTGSGVGTQSFMFDTRGNRTTSRRTGTYNSTTTYTYDLNNRLMTTLTVAGAMRVVTTFTYDRNGNQLTSTSGVTVETRTYNVLVLQL